MASTRTVVLNGFVNSINLRSTLKEEELLDLAGLEQLLGAKPDLTGLWDLANQEDLVQANASAESGEPDTECFITFI